MLIIFDGPEKSGKTTLINEIYRTLHHSEINCVIKKWGPIFPDDRVYLPHVKADANTDEFVIWDRGWPSEHVYAKLLGRMDRRLRNNAWLGEWLYGRACTLKIMVLPNLQESINLRDETDLPTDVLEECRTFQRYANDFGWNMIYNNFTSNCLQSNREDIMHLIMNCTPPVIPMPFIVGPKNARVLFIGERRNVDGKYPGGWLPFSSPLTQRYGRILGNKAFQFSWTNVGDIPIEEVMKYELVVACGTHAYNWVSEIRRPKKLMSLPHPAWLYRYNTAETQEVRPLVQRTLTSIGENYGYENY